MSNNNPPSSESLPNQSSSQRVNKTESTSASKIEEKINKTSEEQQLATPDSFSDTQKESDTNNLTGDNTDKSWLQRNIYLVAGGVTFLVAVIVVVGLVFILDDPKEEELERINEEEQEEILSEITRNNPIGVFDFDDNVLPSTSTLGQSTEEAVEAQQAINPEALLPEELSDPEVSASIPAPQSYPGQVLGRVFVAPPNINVYNYRYTKTTREPGPANGQCGSYYALDEAEVSEYFEYFDYDRSFHKNVTETESGYLKRYELGKYGVDINEYLVYKGGDIAAKKKYKPYEGFSNEYRFDQTDNTPSYPVSYPSDYVLDMFNSYGDVRITDFWEENGTTFYEVTVLTNGYCNADEPWEPTNAFFTIYTVNSDTYEITQTRKFIDRVDETTLLYTLTTDFDRQKVDISRVRRNFQFDREADVISVNYENYEFDQDREFRRVRDYLNKSGQQLLNPDLDEYSITTLYGNNFPERVQNERYYLRRDFYPTGRIGQALYDQVIEARKKSPTITMSFFTDENTDEYGWYDHYAPNIRVEIYQPQDDYTAYELLHLNTWEEDPLIYEKKLNVNGEEITATVFQAEYNIYTNEPIASYPPSYTYIDYWSYTSYPGSYPTQYVYVRKAQHVAFEYNGVIFMLHYYGLDDQILFETDYTISSINDTRATYRGLVNSFRDIIGNAFYGYY